MTALSDSKIVSDYLINPAPKEANEKAKGIVKQYGEFCQKFVWAPNCSSHYNPMDPPSGFSMAVTGKDAPLYSDVFSPTKMFYGTIAMPLEGAVMKSDKSPLTESYFIKNLVDIGRALNVGISQQSSMPISLDTHYDPKMSEDKQQWIESLGGSGSYAGIFASSERRGYKYNNRLWLVVQAGNVEASEELYRSIQDAQPTWDASKDMPAKQNWNNFFFNNKQTLYLWNSVTRSRERLMASMADAMGIQVNSDIDPYSSNKKKLLKPMISTVSYNITIDKETNSPVYHSGTVDPSSCSGPIIQNENPHVGPTILRGPEERGKEFGGKWTASEGSLGNFPTGTGRLISFNKSNKQKLSADAQCHVGDNFVWESKEAKNNIRLSDNVYRQRDLSFKKVEQKLGYDHAWGEVPLRPILVKMCSP